MRAIAAQRALEFCKPFPRFLTESAATVFKSYHLIGAMPKRALQTQKIYDSTVRKLGIFPVKIQTFSESLPSPCNKMKQAAGRGINPE
jgi:hypothetical protein